MSQSQDIEAVTTAISTEGQPDNKTRRYDRQLRLWAATGQSALESSRILVISASATATSILKNLVLPGIGHFTILDHELVSPEDAGNNFFFEGYKSIGKSRAEEAVRLLGELNDGVEGKADTRNVEDLLNTDQQYFAQFTLIIVHNLRPSLLQKLADFLWSDSSYPPLIAVRSAGFLAQFFIQFHEHTIIESHSEMAPSLRIDKPFPSLLEHALSLDFDNMDPTEHAHIPYVVILVRAIEDWKKSHGGQPPKTYAEKKEFKKGLLSMKKKVDEENFDEAEAQAYRAWTETGVPSEISSLFQDPSLSSLSPSSPEFFHLLAALHKFTLRPPHTLPLTSTLPDMRSDTKNYIHLQTLYKKQAEEEKAIFKDLVKAGGVEIDDELIDLFVKNAHGLLVLRGKQIWAFDSDRAGLANALATSPRETSTHLAMSALTAFTSKNPTSTPTAEDLRSIVEDTVGPDAELPSHIDDAVGEIARAPTADLPNVAAFLGGMVAQEAIKMITKQYVPQRGYTVVDMVEMWTGAVGA